MKAGRAPGVDAAPSTAAPPARQCQHASPDLRSSLLELQRSAGNRAVRRLLDGAPPPGAERVLRMRGTPLPEPLRGEMERRFGDDFGSVRLHTGAAADAAVQAAGARAFAHGEHLVFGRNAPALVAGAGRVLLAHELAHVLQQRRGGPALAAATRAAAERGAERAAQAVASGAELVPVEGASAVGLARDGSVPAIKLPPLEVVEVKDRAYTVTVDGVLVFQAEVPQSLPNPRISFRLEGNDNLLAIGVDGDAEVTVRLQSSALAQLAAKGYNARLFDTRRSRHEDTGSTVFIEPSVPQRKPPDRKAQDRKPQAARQTVQPNSKKPESAPQGTRQPLPPKTPPREPPVKPVPPQPATVPPVVVPPQPTGPAPLTQQQLDAIAPQLRAELDEANAAVASLIAYGTLGMGNRALNEYRGMAQRLDSDEKFLREIEPRSGAMAKEVQAAVVRVTVLKQMFTPMAALAAKWHEDNSYGKSLGMLNEEAGTWLAGKGIEQFDKGGVHYISGGAAFVGAFIVAFVDLGEKLITFGYHDAATAVAQAYERGDISWSDADRIMRKAFWRTLLIAAVTRGAGMATSRLGIASAEALGLAPTATRFGLVTGGVTGGLTSASTLGTQAIATWAMAGDFSSPQAKVIWNSGIPQDKEWAIAIPLGMLLGAAGGVRAVQVSNSKLIGTVVDTPGGPVKIVSVTSRGQVIAKPLGASNLDVPPAPPSGDLVFTYDPATRAWRTPAPTATPPGNVPPEIVPPGGAAAPLKPVAPSATQTPSPGGQAAPVRPTGAAQGPKGPAGPRGPGGGGGRSPLDPSSAPKQGPVALYLPGQGVNPAVPQLTGPARDAVLKGRLQLLDELGRPISVRRLRDGGLVADIDTTLLNESRLVDPAGRPLAGQVPAPWTPLLDASGQPLPFAPRTGPLVLDLQAGTPSYGSRVAQQVPGAQVLGVEGGNWLLAYRGIYPTNRADLNLSLQIARNTPVWPDTPAFRTSVEGLPRALPWEIDPAPHLFPRQGPVSMLADPAQPNLGSQFFPAIGKAGRLVPFNPGDVTGLLVEPPLSLPGQADQILLRRPFALGTADAATSEVMGQRIGQMLKPGGFVEFRPTRPTDIGAPQIEAVGRAIPGSTTFRVEAADVLAFKSNGQFPAGMGAIEQDMIRAAVADLTGLGPGEFNFVVRIYAPTAPTSTPSP